MTISLDQVVPWGRSFDEYLAIFDMSESDLQGSVLGCADGPAAFNRTLTRRGGRVISVDPLYQYSVEQMEQRISETYATVLKQARKNHRQFVWTRIPSVKALGQIRLAAMDDFLRDFPAGLQQGRYRQESLPDLSFAEGAFDLALCSHFLFLYSELLSEAFHISAIKELCRVATEIRIFPLLDMSNSRSRHVGPVIAQLDREGFACDIRAVDYEFQKGGNEMMVVTSKM